MVKLDTGAAAHYFTQAYAHALVNFFSTNTVPWIRLPDNSTMELEQVGHLPLALPPVATETHVF